MNCGSAFERGASGLPYLLLHPPSLLFNAVLGALALWKQIQKKKIPLTEWIHCGSAFEPGASWNYSNFVFVDEKSGRYLAIPYVRKSKFLLVFLQFVAKIARFPQILVCDSSDEMLSATMVGKFALRGLSLHVVPKGEHFANGPAERACNCFDR